MVMFGGNLEKMLESTVKATGSCRKCGTPISFEEGTGGAMDLGIRDQVVMCPKCSAIYDVNVTPRGVELRSDVTDRYAAQLAAAGKTSASGGTPPADWYPDPSGRHQHRYWDGAAWTDHVASGGSQSVDHLDGAPASNDRVEKEGKVSGAAPPDWYPDPGGRHQHRYWDGTAWTDHVASGGSQSLDHLEGAPASDDQASAKTGEPAIVEETGMPAVEPLIAALGDPDLDVRVSAAAALVQISAPGFEPLIAALKDQNTDVRAFAAVTLGQIGDAAVEPLILALKQYPDKRSGVAQILGQIGDPRAVEPLIVALKDQNDYVRQWAAHALGKIGDPRAVEPLSAALKDQNEDVRKWAAYALGKIGVPAVEPLSAAFGDQNEDVRIAAVEARPGASSTEEDNMGTRPT